MALIHLIFTSLRIFILSIVYAYLIVFLITRFNKSKKFKKRYIIPLIFVVLFLWRFSYWRNSGFGDSARVPLTSKYHIEMIDFDSASLNIENRNLTTDGRIKKLYEKDNILYAKTGENYLILDMDNEKLIKNMSYEEFIQNKGNTKSLMTLGEFHSDYWGISYLLY